MASWHLLSIFLLTTFAFAYMPGPAMLYTATQTLTKGKWSGLMAVLGIHLGGYFHIAVAALGLTAIFTLIPTLYIILKVLGACWLVYLGWQLLHTKHKVISNGMAGCLPNQTLRQSVVVEVLNPKTAIFYVAFLPQFIDSYALLPIWLQFLLLGFAVNAIFTSADVCCVYSAQRLVKKLTTTAKRMVWLRRAGAAVFMSLGLYLLVQER